MLEAMKQTLADPMILWGKVAEFLPSLLTALGLLIGGHFIAKLLAGAMAKLFTKIGLDRLAETAGIDGALKKAGMTSGPSQVLAKILYWLVFLTFIISASDALGLDRVSATIDHFVLYIPKVISALILTLIGLFIAGLVRTAIEASLASINLGYERTIGGIIYALIVVIVVSLAINQLEIETDLLNQVVIIFLLSGAGAVALALGLGTKHVAGNVVAGVYARELYVPGNKIKVADVSGEVIEICSTALIIQTDDGRKITIPNSKLIDSQVEILSQ
jgi:small-conductance mechanosensitive channel